MTQQSAEIQALKKELQEARSLIINYKKLITINTIIASFLNKDKVLQTIIQQTKNLLNCEKCSVLLINPNINKLYFNIISNHEEMASLAEITLDKGEGIAGTVWETGKPFLLDDVSQDPRFSDKVDKKMHCETKSLLAVPLIVNNKIIGVMEALNKINNQLFTNQDLEFLQDLSVQAAIAIENATLYETAIKDGLTKLFVKNYFKQRLVEEYNRAVRYQRDLALVIFDIDFFKKINDSYGHHFGDRILEKVAEILLANCRTVDLPCRYGGEEFVVLLPETDNNGAFDFAERIRDYIEKLIINYKKQKITFTISGGVSSFFYNKPNNCPDFFEFADKALYFSKENGRNRISSYKTGN